MFPKLAAQNEEYLVKQMQAFKDGSRAGATMGAMVQGLSTNDMQDIAAYYEAQQVTKNALPPLDFEDEDDDGEPLGKKQLAANKKRQQMSRPHYWPLALMFIVMVIWKMKYLLVSLVMGLMVKVINPLHFQH